MSFKKEFPTLCGINLESSMISLPCMIASGLFLGSRPVNSFERRENKQLSLDRKTLYELGIEYVIVNADASLSLSDTENLHCLLVDVPDTDEIDMSEYWYNAIDLIEEVRSQGKRVLVQIHGRSRSAALMVAWAMHLLRLPFARALEYVHTNCFYKLDENLMYLDQLARFGERKRLEMLI